MPLDPEAGATLSEDEQPEICTAYQTINQTPGVTLGNGLQAPEIATTVGCRTARRSQPTDRSSTPKRRSTAISSTKPATSMLPSSWPRRSRQPVWTLELVHDDAERRLFERRLVELGL
jgi:hypothetical protein